MGRPMAAVSKKSIVQTMHSRDNIRFMAFPPEKDGSILSHPRWEFHFFLVKSADACYTVSTMRKKGTP
jgi:hypothetical protein